MICSPADGDGGFSCCCHCADEGLSVEKGRISAVPKLRRDILFGNICEAWS